MQRKWSLQIIEDMKNKRFHLKLVMTIISYNKNFIFIKSSKTAGTSMEIALSKFCGTEDVIAPLDSFAEDMRKSENY